MHLNIELNFKIKDKDYTFRTLVPEDVSEYYINSLNENRKYIQNVPDIVSITSQKEHIQKILDSSDDVICGLFSGDTLIGTAGIQNLTGNRFIEIVDGYTSNCTIGIFVFLLHLGNGLGKTLVWLSCMLAHKCHEIQVFEACMKKDNIFSLKSFLACGFHVIKENEVSHNVMLEFSHLIKPNLIENFSYKEIKDCTKL